MTTPPPFEPKLQVHMKIAKPVAEVFEAVVDPGKLSAYFTTGGASARLESGTVVQWEFSDHPGGFPVRIEEVVAPSRIVLHWESAEGGYDTRVEMTFEALGERNTKVSIAESGWRATQAGLKATVDNAGGWMHMLCCMKAWLEHGITLREGAF